MAYDVAAVRSHFPALLEGAAHFDGPGGSQTPDVVARAVADTLTSAISNRGTITPAERRADAIVTDARAAVGDLLAVDPAGVVFGRSATELTFVLARTLAEGWGPGDEVVVTRLDHDANIRPWVHAAEASGATVRWADFDPATGELTADDIAAVVSGRTRVVAVTGASNLIGSRPDLPAIADIAHEAGALLHVDGVHASAHTLTDLDATGADTWVCSPYKFLGPHHGILAAAPETLEPLHPAKLLPSSDEVPERFELGTLPYELLAGTTAAIDFLASLAASDSGSPGGAGSPGGSGGSDRSTGSGGSDRSASSGDAGGDGSRRNRLVASFASLEAHEDGLLARVEGELRRLPGVTVHSNAARRTPTLLFTAAGHDPQAIRASLAERAVNAPAGHFYAWECSQHLGLGSTGGVRIGLAPYTDDEDVDRLLDGLREILGA